MPESNVKFDKRLNFVGRAINAGYNPNLANEWYIANGGDKLDNAVALAKFVEWLRENQDE